MTTARNREHAHWLFTGKLPASSNFALVPAENVKAGDTLRNGSIVIRVERPSESTVVIHERLTDGDTSEGYWDHDEHVEVRKPGV